MPVYVSLVKWTDQGIKNYRDTVDRARDYAALVERHGGRVRELLWAIGEYDIVTVAEFPDDDTGVAAMLRQVGAVQPRAAIRSNQRRWPSDLKAALRPPQ